MTDAGKILVVIPARGGSKRLPRKNVLPLAGKPLICWTIEAALDAKLDSRIVVTSDDEEILSITNQYAPRGVIAHKRSENLAIDTASTTDALIDAVKAQQKLGYDARIVVLLQPTSPLRNHEDIQEAIRTYSAFGKNKTLVSVCEVDHPAAWVGKITKDGCLTGIDLSGKRSQDYEIEYRLNGAIYILDVRTLLLTQHMFTKQLIPFVMPRDRSWDIDTALDFTICESVKNHHYPS